MNSAARVGGAVLAVFFQEKAELYCGSIAGKCGLCYDFFEVIRMIDRQKFGAFVAALRKERGYTQKELAERLFISDKAVSKWETGVSIPDTELLVPLAELLHVSVTELLLCERVEREAPIRTGEVEDIVKTAIAYSDDRPAQRRRARRKWTVIYALSVVGGSLGLLWNHLQGNVSETVGTGVLLGIIFGAYFCFFAREKLPTYYDQNRINGVHDGVFRMNVPGVRFNNSNWPYIVLTGRIWACLSVALLPLLSGAMTALYPVFWLRAEKYVFLALLLGGLFFPMYLVGRKFE